jgi:EAL domain-containing protein (putative c-di-GMP-specific phosphodiesterase class I)
MRCQLVQGFLIGRPAPAARVREQLWSAADPLLPAGQAAAG